MWSEGNGTQPPESTIALMSTTWTQRHLLHLPAFQTPFGGMLCFFWHCLLSTDCLSRVVVTFCTVGYGGTNDLKLILCLIDSLLPSRVDFVPTSSGGKVIGMITIYLGVLLISMPVRFSHSHSHSFHSFHSFHSSSPFPFHRLQSWVLTSVTSTPKTRPFLLVTSGWKIFLKYSCGCYSSSQLISQNVGLGTRGVLTWRSADTTLLLSSTCDCDWLCVLFQSCQEEETTAHGTVRQELRKFMQSNPRVREPQEDPFWLDHNLINLLWWDRSLSETHHHKDDQTSQLLSFLIQTSL